MRKHVTSHLVGFVRAQRKAPDYGGQDIAEWAVPNDADYIALSFVQPFGPDQKEVSGCRDVEITACMVVFQTRGPQYRPQNITLLMIGTLKMVPLISGNPQLSVSGKMGMCV